MLLHIQKRGYVLGRTLLKWKNIHHMKNHQIHLFFAGKGLKAAKSASDTARSSTTGMSSSNGLSPSKRLIMRSQCIEQLDRWHTLWKRGVLPKQIMTRCMVKLWLT